MPEWVYLVRDGAIQTVAVFSTWDKAVDYINARDQSRFWDVEEVAVDQEPELSHG
jgi:hypothetical protein